MTTPNLNNAKEGHPLQDVVRRAGEVCREMADHGFQWWIADWPLPTYPAGAAKYCIYFACCRNGEQAAGPWAFGWGETLEAALILAAENTQREAKVLGMWSTPNSVLNERESG